MTATSMSRSPATATTHPITAGFSDFPKAPSPPPPFSTPTPTAPTPASGRAAEPFPSTPRDICTSKPATARLTRRSTLPVFPSTVTTAILSSRSPSTARPHRTIRISTAGASRWSTISPPKTRRPFLPPTKTSDRAGPSFCPPPQVRSPSVALAPRNLLVGSGKDGVIYLINRDNMGKYDSSTDNIVQEIAGGVAAAGSFDTPAFYYDGATARIYYAGASDNLRAFTISNGYISTAPAVTPDTFGLEGATPSISANGDSDGIVWGIDEGSSQLRAYNASNVAAGAIYSTATNSSRDSLGTAVKFTVPTVADGEVFVGTSNALVIYGLLAPRPPRPPLPTRSSPRPFPTYRSTLPGPTPPTMPSATTSKNLPIMETPGPRSPPSDQPPPPPASSDFSPTLPIVFASALITPWATPGTPTSPRPPLPITQPPSTIPAALPAKPDLR